MTLGPTREYLDSVRFLSNASSGKMGRALAEKFISFGARVALITGPGVDLPLNCVHRQAESAREMLREVKRLFPSCDFFVAAAAVSDYRPNITLKKKLKKKSGSWTLRLVRNPDILYSMSLKKKRRFFVGFALEDSNGEESALKKMREKKCDLMVLNPPSSMESDKTRATLLFSDGSAWRLGNMCKEQCASKICHAIVSSLKMRDHG